MRLPRDISGKDLAKLLQDFGYQETRQRGSHVRLTTEKNGTHHVTVPAHDPIKIGTLRNILRDVAQHFDMTADAVASRLF